MNHDEAARLLGSYLDGELDVSTCLTLEDHLTGCPSCREKLAGEQQVADFIAAETPRFAAPPHLKTRIQSGLRKEISSSHRAPSHRRFSAAWTSAGLALAALVVLTFALPWIQGVPALDQEAIENHVRSLQVNHLLDVASTDQHTVKPWFAGKLDYSPQVVDLGPAGYPLLGGRLDVLFDRNVAAIIYQRRKHYINLFIWPTDGARIPAGLYTKNGYHALGWTKSGMDYLAISELGEKEFRQFVNLIQAQTLDARPGE